MTTYLYALDGEVVAVYTTYKQDVSHDVITSTPNKSSQQLTESVEQKPVGKQEIVDTYQPLKLQDLPIELQVLIQEDAIEFDGVDKYLQQDAPQNRQNLSDIQTRTEAKPVNPTYQVDKHLVINLKNLPDHIIHQLQHTLPIQLVSIRELLTYWQQTQIYHVFKAMQVLRWREEHTFCSRCGGRTSQHRYELAMVCNTCHYRQYPRLQPCVIVAVTRKVSHAGKTKSQILLAKDRRFKRDMYSVLAGFVEVGETLEQAVERETFEETAIRVGNMRYLASQPWAFPSNIMIAFQAEYVSGEINIDTDELLDAKFYDYDKLPNIPPKGSISYAMIRHICDNQPLQL